MIESEQTTLSISDSAKIKDLPTVTVAIPVYNEEKHIRRVVEGFLATEYPNLVEILIADGRSTDQTREIIAELSKEDPRVKLIDNPEKYQSYGLNHMIDAAEGEIFLRADGHCHYKADYVEKCVSVMLETGARNVGGAQRYMAKNRVQAGIALAVKSILGNGGAKYMNEQYLGYADTVFLGCFRTADLRELNGFNTENITNEDAELNLRLNNKFGNAIYISPEIKSWYLPRDSFSKLLKQYFNYGRGRLFTSKLHKNKIPIRSKAPFNIILVLLLITIFCLTTQNYAVIAGLTFFLGSLLIFETFRVLLRASELQITKNENSEILFFPSILVLPFYIATTILIMHLGHFLGYGYQMLRMILRKNTTW